MSPEAEIKRLRLCISMAMGCISPLSKNIDERLAWYRLLDALEGRFPRPHIYTELRPANHPPEGE